MYVLNAVKAKELFQLGEEMGLPAGWIKMWIHGCLNHSHRPPHLKLLKLSSHALLCMCMSNDFYFAPLLGEEYIIRDGKVAIVDTFTGRVLEGRRWSDGMHQAIECQQVL